MKAIALACILCGLVSVSASNSVATRRSESSRSQRAAGPDGAVTYVAFFWRVRSGMFEAYQEDLKANTALIDENARLAGAFESVASYVASPSRRGPLAGPVEKDWTHIRVFKLKPGETLDMLLAGLQDAGKRVYPDEARRKQQSAHSAELKDLVKMETWSEMK